MSESKPGRGGKRPGSGRKPNATPNPHARSATLAIRLNAAELDALRALAAAAGAQDVSTWARSVLLAQRAQPSQDGTQ